MTRNLLKTLAVLAAFVLMLGAFNGCSKEMDDGFDSVKNEEFVTEDVDLNYTVDSESDKGYGTVGSTSGGTESLVQTNRKIIETVNLSVQTKAFDNLISGINAKIKELGGYVESSDIIGRESNSSQNRRAEMKVRIPSGKSEEFSGYISKESVVIRRTVNTDDVTLDYVDMESRLSVLKAEKTALENLLKDAKNVEDIISVREKLTNVISDIEAYEAKLRTYDNLVDYTTINLTVSEVERTAVVEKQGVWQEIGTNLGNNFAILWGGMVSCFVFVISAIPYLLIPAVIVALLIVVLKIKKKKNKNKIKGEEQNESNQ